MSCHIPFESTTFPLSNGIINYMIAFEIIKLFIFLKIVPDNLIFDIAWVLRVLRVLLEKNAIQATTSIWLVNNDLALDFGTCQRWFARFSSGDFDLNHRPESPIEANDSHLEELFEQNRR